MDGEAISLAFTTTSGPDCLKEVISQFGLRLKVYKAIKEELVNQEEMGTSRSSIQLSDDDIEEPVKQNPLPTTSTKPILLDNSASASSSSPQSVMRTPLRKKVPNPFLIPAQQKKTSKTKKLMILTENMFQNNGNNALHICAKPIHFRL
ncbi:uncharacterized protein [Dysidea avara]|uniref:uncharacterized protein isoform X2 n=1 Tax=Dysidea avara TaxID=196820 RepID=UPI00331C2307